MSEESSSSGSSERQHVFTRGKAFREELRWRNVVRKVFEPIEKLVHPHFFHKAKHGEESAENCGSNGEGGDPVHNFSNVPGTQRTIVLSEQEEHRLEVIRKNLPPNVEIETPFGKKKVCYADYTASGRPLLFIDEYMTKVVNPMFANTHTETSATGLQTTHFREEARDIVLQSLGGNNSDHTLIFAGSGMTGAMEKFISMLGIHVPFSLRSIIEKAVPLSERPLVMISESEHHSNELVWRENYIEIVVIPSDETGSLSITAIERVLKEHHGQEKNSDGKQRLVMGCFTAGSNVTGLRNDFYSVSILLHKYGARSCWDFAAAAPYVDINMSGNGLEPSSYLDAVIFSPHKFVGGPGSPGVLVARKDMFYDSITADTPPTMPGGGTVQMVWSNGVMYEDTLSVREEAGTPNIMGAIRCGLAFHVRSMIGAKRIEEIEGDYASRAVHRLQAAGAWVMGDEKTNISKSHMRLSITSFNVPFKAPIESGANAAIDGKLLHPHFVCQLLNDLYGIQSRSGCSCAGPLSFRLFHSRMGGDFPLAVLEEARAGFHSFKPGWARLNFNYFISEDEFQFLCTAIEQILQYGWKLLPLYALCLQTGQYTFNSSDPFNRFDGVRLIRELKFSEDNCSVEWIEPVPGTVTRQQMLDQAMEIFNSAPDRVRKVLHRFRDLKSRDSVYPCHMEPYRYFILASEVLPFLGITKEELEAAQASESGQNEGENPSIVGNVHSVANPAFTSGRPRH